MTRLKLSDVTDEKPVKLTVEISAGLHRKLVEYGIVLNGGETSDAPQPTVLIGPMLERFIASDRAFARERSKRRA